MSPLHPPDPRRAKTRPFPMCVLGSQKSSTYPWVRAGLGRLGVGGVKCRYASGSFPPAALLTEHFEHPTYPISGQLFC
jgi:hypothetical protein